jgi:putative ABC transport system permease protein
MGLMPVAESYRSRWLVERLVGFCLAVAVTVTVLFSLAGIHTLVAFAAARGRREIGIRAALGARPRRLVTGLFGRVLRPVAIGGVAGAVGATFLNAWLLESTTSTWTFLLSGVLMIVAVALAVLGPARRVIGVDPADELRAG